MTTQLPALAMAAVPGRRKKTLDLAKECEDRGYEALYCASFGDAVGLCEAMAFTTERIVFGTAIANMYTRHVNDYATTASLIHELSDGRFRFGIGVSHTPMNARLGLQTGKPLGDTREFAEAYKAAPRVGELPPLVIAALRKKMVALAGEVGDGVVFANVARSHVPTSLGALPPEKANDPDFVVADMIPTCISDDREAAAAVNRKTLMMYVNLPNYRNYWKDSGYRRGDGGDRGRHRREGSRQGHVAHDGRVAQRLHALRHRRRDPRRRRGLAGSRRAYAHPRALVHERRPDGGLRGALRCLRVSPPRRIGCARCSRGPTSCPCRVAGTPSRRA